MFCLSWRGKSCLVKNYPFLFLEMEWATSFLCLFVVCIWCHLEEDRKCIDLENGFKHVMYVFCANMCILCYIQNHLHLKVFFMAKWENKPKSYIVLAKACLKLCHFLLVKYVFVIVNSDFWIFIMFKYQIHFQPPWQYEKVQKESENSVSVSFPNLS